MYNILIYFQDCLWLLHSSRSGVNISAPWLLLLSRLEVNNALTANIMEIEIKEVEMVAVDDFDDMLQEELFGRPVTDLDSLWCSD